ncbi:integral membrane protein [Nannizzia gypsea CBS 118893]|uniref:Integral membrane protein n=1 Tax=Arthroderma gypseum (strain ATCC MYA-4604 / CBS 118893) TaxID=535722 RepID=E4V5C8_ARTGP|nr:integral membrane protein [Nannizzia gypsea CBS 118893]EFR05202.1 integral membrane protein [Nannizzia gypsea CBS 118893]
MMYEDVNSAQKLVVLTWTLLAITTVITSARVYTRLVLIKAFGWDDGFMVLALACSAVNSALITTSISHGTGRHQVFLSEAQRTQADKYNWISQSFHVMSTNWAKVSIMFLLLRLIQKAKSQAPYIYGGMVLLTLSNVMCVYTIFGQCTPVQSLWDHSIPGKCWNPSVQRDYAFFQGAISAFSDLVLAVYPVHLVLTLHIPVRLKLALGSILALGLIAMGAAIVKTIFLSRLSARADYSWNTIDLVVWACIEQYLIIIAACIPTLGPLVKIILNETLSSAPRSTQASSKRWRHTLRRKPRPGYDITLPSVGMDTLAAAEAAGVYGDQSKLETGTFSTPIGNKLDSDAASHDPIIRKEES